MTGVRTSLLPPSFLQHPPAPPSALGASMPSVVPVGRFHSFFSVSVRKRKPVVCLHLHGARTTHTCCVVVCALGTSTPSQEA